METKKILVLGDSESGKKTALEYICNDLVKTEAASYGKTSMKSKKLSIFSPSGAHRFRFMKEILSKNVDGAIIFIDNTRGVTPSSEEMIEFVKEKAVPCVIFANKQDLNNNPLHTNSDIPVVPTQAISGEGVTIGLNTLLELIEHNYRGAALKT